MSARVNSVLGFMTLMMLMAGSVPVCSVSQESAMENRFRHGTEAMHNGSFDEAARDFLAVIRASPRFAEAYLNLGLAHEQQGKYEEAIQSLQQALNSNRRYGAPTCFLGLRNTD